jgi:hypothetical protein
MAGASAVLKGRLTCSIDLEYKSGPLIHLVLLPGTSTTLTIVAMGGSQYEGSVAFAPANFTVRERQNVTLVSHNEDTRPTNCRFQNSM